MDSRRLEPTITAMRGFVMGFLQLASQARPGMVLRFFPL
jgi:hypothetical protein